MLDFDVFYHQSLSPFSASSPLSLIFSVSSVLVLGLISLCWLNFSRNWPRTILETQILQVKTDGSPSIPTKYGIRSIPTVFFKNGMKKDAVFGAVSEPTLTTCIERMPISYSSPSSSSPKSWVIHYLAAGAVVAAGLGALVYHRQPIRFRCRAIGIIPARYASTRFQGKPLVQILGKPMIQRTWERAKLATTLDHVVVATDDDKIAECCSGFGADVVMTSESCRNGTERCNEVLQKIGKKYDVVVNIQGDEPLIDPETIDGVVKALQAAPDAVFSTAVTSLKPEDAFDPNRVKCVVDNRGYAIYFSRGLVPFNKSGKVNPRFPYLLHLGIQSFDAKFLKIYPELLPTPLQLEEDLEQLKVLENGYKMKVIKVDHESHGVDIPEDVEKIEHYMRERNLP